MERYRDLGTVLAGWVVNGEQVCVVLKTGLFSKNIRSSSVITVGMDLEEMFAWGSPLSMGSVSFARERVWPKSYAHNVYDRCI